MSQSQHKPFQHTTGLYCCVCLCAVPPESPEAPEPVYMVNNIKFVPRCVSFHASPEFIGRKPPQAPGDLPRIAGPREATPEIGFRFGLRLYVICNGFMGPEASTSTSLPTPQRHCRAMRSTAETRLECQLRVYAVYLEFAPRDLGPPEAYAYDSY